MVIMIIQVMMPGQFIFMELPNITPQQHWVKSEGGRKALPRIAAFLQLSNSMMESAQRKAVKASHVVLHDGQVAVEDPAKGNFKYRKTYLSELCTPFIGCGISARKLET